ncbi:MAG: TIM barrel protein [Acidobacteria bacterium]|nr:TIM barrel protein [Acidobacteriota bacterium]
MIRLGMHSDNWRHLDKPFEVAVNAAVELGLDCIEFGVFDGQYFIQALGYSPHLPLSTDPAKLRRYLDSKGLQVSQIDAAYPLTSPDTGPYGVPYVRRAILFAEAIGCPCVDTTDGAAKPEGYTDEEILALMKHNLRLILETAEEHKVIVNVETHGPYTTNLETMRRIMGFFESEYLRVNFDTGNTYISGNDPLEFLKGVRKWVSHCHVKDVSAELAAAVRGESTGIATSLASIGAGVNARNIEACIRYLQDTGWNGVLSIECEGADEILHPSVNWLRGLLVKAAVA